LTLFWLLDNRPPVIYGDGRQTKDFIHVKDAADAIVKAVENPATIDICNLGSGISVTMNRLARTMIGLAGRSVMDPYTNQLAPETLGTAKRAVVD